MKKKLRKRPSSACASSAALFNNGAAECLTRCMPTVRERKLPRKREREKEKRKKLLSMRSGLKSYDDLHRDWKLLLEDANRQHLYFFHFHVIIHINIERDIQLILPKKKRL